MHLVHLDIEFKLTVKTLKGIRNRKGNHTNELEVLIQWEGLFEVEPTWEDVVICWRRWY